MNKYELFEAISYLSDEKINQADHYHRERYKMKPVLKYAGIVLASISIIISGTISLYLMNEYENSKTLTNGETHIEDDDTIFSNNSFVKYNNIYYYLTNQTLDEKDINSLIGNGKAVFYNTSQQILTETCSVYSIQNEDAKKKIAIKINNKYFVFTNDKDIWDTVKFALFFKKY